MTTLIAKSKSITKVKSNIKPKSITMTQRVFKHTHHHHRAHAHQHSLYHAEHDIAFMTSDDLASRLSNGYLPTIVIDTRDNAVSEGQIRGALVCPEPNFRREEIKFLVKEAKERKRVCNTGISNHKCCVVFYCKNSKTYRRSIRCASRFWQAVRECGATHDICVKVLQGGADSWFRSHKRNHLLVQDFDERRWESSHSMEKPQAVQCKSRIDSGNE